MKHPLPRTFLLVIVALAGGSLTAQAHKELGRMWTFENAPLAWFKEAYDFTPSPEWLEHARLSALRLPSGCSASFVSPHGLIMTNNHCARGAVAKVCPKDQNWLTEGYYAGDVEHEVKLPDFKAQTLIATKDVTSEVRAGASPEAIATAADKEDAGHVHQVVTLYQGGMYELYTYQEWKDLRLVCTPHLQSAHFGGDPDNFCFPRYALDFTFLRAYENDRPADTGKQFFAWQTAGPRENELVFVVGNPGSTGRLQTLAQCEFLRDHVFPARLARVHKQLDQLNANPKAQDDPELRAAILGAENTRKAVEGYRAGLQDPRILAIKQKAEAELKAKVAQQDELQQRYGDAWDQLAELQQRKVSVYGNPDTDEAAKKLADDPAWKQLLEAEAKQQKRVGEACFAVYGTSIPPDASRLTLRLADGVVKGFRMNGTIAPFFTTLYGLFARHTEFGGVHPFDLPQAWLDARDKLDLKTPCNFVSTNDIIGGNSGSPVIDQQQHVVGLIFDGNIESLGNNYVFDDEVARSVSVHPAFIIEALRKVYRAGKLADELENRTQAYQPGDTVGR